MHWGDLSKYRSQIYGISIIWIVIFHFYEIFFDKFNFTWLSSVIINNGYIGVDIFLFLSGISMSYAMKRYQKLNVSSLIDFYRRRFGKILKVYLCFCVPFLMLRDLFFERNLVKFLKQLLFIDWHVSSFWYLAVIMVCYLIYPFLEMLIRKGRRRWIIGITAGYIILLCLSRFLCSGLFSCYEVLWTRIPIFMIGVYFSQKVRENERMSLKEIGGYISIILLKSPIVFAVSRIPVLGPLNEVVSRLLLGWMGIGIMIVMLLFVKLYENSVIDKWITKIGAVTLEIYVFHIAFRYAMVYLFRLLGIELTAYRFILPFGAIFVPLSIVGGYCLALFLNGKLFKFKKTTKKQSS